MGSARIIVGPGILDEVIQHACRCFPEEGCGFLVGKEYCIERFVPAENSLRSKIAYSVEPRFLFEFFRHLRASGEDLIGIYHSHPSEEAFPSERDIAEAHYPDAVQVIVSLRDENEPVIRAFRLIQGDIAEIELHAIV